MQSRYLLSTLLLVCSAATSADNAGWQNARTPQTTNSASDHVQNASQNTGGVPATLVKGELPAPGQASPLVQDAARLDSELSADEIRSLRSLMADNERAINAPITSVVPRISSLTVNLSPGASLPLVRTAMNNLSVVTFTDINGSPWPQSDPPYNAAPKLFDVQYNENMVTITPIAAMGIRKYFCLPERSVGTGHPERNQWRNRYAVIQSGNGQSSGSANTTAGTNQPGCLHPDG
ncbi:protein TraN [Escherichia coli]|uniref:Protein TraN n=1 Tax=Escherichia coli TaxID=562 RepID=A0A377A0I7_ECOLX|nr:protein TraN [Escherichia coli]